MKYPEYKPTELEPQIQQFWEKHKILDKLRKQNAKKGERFYFLQGPPYTSGKLHLGHAWNHALKDVVLRYQRMRGLNVWDRAGYDMHGLPTEHKVMEKFQLKTKEDIEKFGLERFAKECLAFSTEMAGYMNHDLQRLGVTLDYRDPYFPVSNEYMEGCWFLVKKAHEKGRLYLGERALQWCAHCETALAKHECEYKEITDTSIFVKFPVTGKKNEYLIIWTTTPWTLAFNLGVMANPELDYVKAKVGNEYWILAKVLAASVIQGVVDKQFTIVEEMKGIQLKGTAYQHPWEKDIPKFKELKEKYPNVHTVVLSSEYVTTDAGSGLVHMAPGCGPEDYEVGHDNDIPPFNTVTEQGVFPVSMGKFAGWRAKVDDRKFIEALGHAVVASTKVSHDYAHCQRCKQPIIFKATPQWFFGVEDLKGKMLEANKQISWHPQTAKHSFDSWLQNLRDNSITKQRFWGTPLPVWRCAKCKKYDVFGSIKELKQQAKRIPKSIHKPWIDKVTYPCSCGGTRKRIPDVLDVWIDAGCASWNCLYYPQKTDLFKQWYPASFILEGKDQIRGWFNLLMVASFLAFERPSFEKVYMHGFVTDIEGVKMSKSLGNIISPYEVIDKHGADTLRYYTTQTNAGEDLNFSWEECAMKERNLLVLWNIHKFLLTLAKETGSNPFTLKCENRLEKEEQYIFSRLHSTIKEMTNHLEKYEIDQIVMPIENLFLEMSRTYIQLVREKCSSDDEQEKEVCLYTISNVLLETLKLFSPVAPFVTEAIYQNLKEEFKLKKESIHHYPWPTSDEKKINAQLEEEMLLAKSIIQSTLGLREKIGRGVRWPIAEVVVESSDERVREFVNRLSGIVKRQTNVKNLTVTERFLKTKIKIKPNYNKMGPVFGAATPQVIAELTLTSSETILNHLEKEGSYDVRVDGTPLRVTADQLIIEREVQPPYLWGTFPQGQVYLNSEVREELEAEGYAREITRQIQQLRKEAKLEKMDRVRVVLRMSAALQQKVSVFAKEMKGKVGADTLAINPPTISSASFSAKATIKKEVVEIGMTIVK